MKQTWFYTIIQFNDAESYFVELTNGTKQVVLQVYTDGNVSLFKTLS